MAALETMTPFDELSELRSFLPANQIAEITGVRRETISRARPDQPFKPNTERAVDDLYAVVRRLRAVLGDDSAQLRFALKKRQPAFADRSIAELLKEGKVEMVLDGLPHSASDASSPEEQALENFTIDAATEAELAALDASDDESLGVGTSTTHGAELAAELIASDQELSSCLPQIEGRIYEYFGEDLVEIERDVIIDTSAPEGTQHLYLGIRTDLLFKEKIDRLRRFFYEEASLLAPVQDRLTIGAL